MAVLSAGKLTGGEAIGFGSGNFQLQSPDKVITMSVDTVHMGSEPGVDATGTCLFYGADIGKVTAISCIATVVNGSRKKMMAVNIHVASMRVIQAK